MLIAGSHLQTQGLVFEAVIKDSLRRSEQTAEKERWLRSLQISGTSDLSLRLALQTLSQMSSSGNHFHNRISGEHQLEYLYRWTRKGLSVTLKLSSELGYVLLPDSLFYKQKDVQSIRYDVSSKVSRNWHLSLSTCTTTPLYRMTRYDSDDSLGTISIFAGSFMTPLTLVVSAGIKVSVKGLGSFHIGLSCLKLVYVNDPVVFKSLAVNRYYGVEKGDQWLCEYGLSSSVDLVKKLTPRLSWQCRLDTFIARNNTMDILFRNLLSLKAGRFMSASLESGIVYDQDLFNIFQAENLLTIGFAIRSSR
jgi:hypothetical protein